MKILYQFALQHANHENNTYFWKKNQKKSKMLHEINVRLKQDCVLRIIDDSIWNCSKT